MVFKGFSHLKTTPAWRIARTMASVIQGLVIRAPVQKSDNLRSIMVNIAFKQRRLTVAKPQTKTTIERAKELRELCL